MSNKICLSKRYMMVFVLVFLVSGFFLAISYFVNNNRVSVNSKASSPKSNQAVIGGHFASPGDYPFFVSIGYSCGGSLIGSQWVLTARHCVLDDNGNIKKPDDILIMADYTDINKSLTSYDLLNNSPKVETVISYEDKWSEVGKEENSVYYSKTGLFSSSWIQYDLNDIVLIKLRDLVDLPTISFPKSDWVIDNLYKNGVVLGTGNIKESILSEKSQSGENLQYGEIVIKQDDETLYNYMKKKDTSLNERFLSAQYIDTWSIGASGDSGGPVIADSGSNKKIQIGIMKDVNKNIYSITSNTFVKVGYYSNWITSKTGIQPESGTWNGSLIPTHFPPSPTPIPLPTINGGQSFCSGDNRFCSSLDKCEDYGDGTFHENKNYKCYSVYAKCCEHK